jgi:hypothetical protein
MSEVIREEVVRVGVDLAKRVIQVRRGGRPRTRGDEPDTAARVVGGASPTCVRPLRRTLGRTNHVAATRMEDQDFASDEEEFHCSFRIWLNAVEMLASSPEEQSRAMGNYNVAWDKDVRAGRSLVGRGYLSPIEEAWVHALAAALEPVDTQVLPSGGKSEANLTAMSHASWEPARYLAGEVLRQLAKSAEANATYLRSRGL